MGFVIVRGGMAVISVGGGSGSTSRLSLRNRRIFHTFAARSMYFEGQFSLAAFRAEGGGAEVSHFHWRSCRGSDKSDPDAWNAKLGVKEITIVRGLGDEKLHG